MSQEEKAKMVLDDLADRLPDMFDMEDIRGRVDEYTPYVMVAIQVCMGVGVCKGRAMG
jgi:dynein heavy chain